MTTVDTALAAVEAAMPDARAELEALVRIPSVSADPEQNGRVRESAEATAALLERSGMEHVRLAGVEGSHPYVIAEWMHAGPDAADGPAVRAPRRPTPGDRRTVEQRSVHAGRTRRSPLRARQCGRQSRRGRDATRGRVVARDSRCAAVQRARPHRG